MENVSGLIRKLSASTGSPPIYCVPDGTTPVEFVRSVEKSGLIEFDRDKSFFVGDLGRILMKHKTWQECLPCVEPFYAIKCNTEPTVVSLLTALGCRFDCASKNELKAVIDLGVYADNIIYANPMKSWGQIEFAMNNDVQMTTLDTECEMMKILKINPSAKLVIRIKVENSKALVPMHSKFGCDPDVTAFQLLMKAAQLKANVAGISFHVGSQCSDLEAYHRALRHARKLFDFGKELGHKMYLLDIGGGFPGIENVEVKFEELAAGIMAWLVKYFSDWQGLRIIAEPGRYYVQNAFSLFTSVLAKVPVTADTITKNIDDKNKIGFVYYLNDGIYTSFNETSPENEAAIYPLESTKNTNTFPSLFWGQSCSPTDKIRDNVMMPEVEEKELIVFEHMGAYKAAISTGFNGFEKSPHFYMVEEKYRDTIASFLPQHLLVQIDRLA